ncbi:MAG TPA: BON domain-containing protein [Bryobacteraceae bacterium]|nr:BON domain-containing protein [Bryobacteraceae bacterium]
MILRICAVLMTLVLVAGVCVAQKQVSDDAIYDNVRIRLASDSEVKGGDLQVDVKQGVVTLSGGVESQRVKDKAGKLTKSVKGVKQVVNNLAIKKH